MSMEKPTTEPTLPKPELAEKAQRFEEIKVNLETVVDAEGKGIDAGIKETVAGLVAHGFPTVQSCEGHVDANEGYPAPWVSIADPAKPKWMYAGQEAIWEGVATERGMTIDDLRAFIDEEAYYEAQNREREYLQRHQNETGESLVEYTEEYKEWVARNQELMRKAQELLNEFYETRSEVDETRKIIADGGDIGFRLHNGGMDYNEHEEEVIQGEIGSNELSDEEKIALAKRLHSYQDEMNAFGKFLREKFFKGSA